MFLQITKFCSFFNGHPKGLKSWVFIERTDVKAETPILWPPDAKSWLIGKDPDAGKDWGQEEKGTTEDEMAGWHHRLDGHGCGWTPEVGDGQGGRPGMLQSTGSQRVGYYWATKLNWTESFFKKNWRWVGNFPGGPVVMASLSRVWGTSLIPSWGAKIPHASQPKKSQDIKQCCKNKKKIQ